MRPQQFWRAINPRKYLIIFRIGILFSCLLITGIFVSIQQKLCLPQQEIPNVSMDKITLVSVMCAGLLNDTANTAAAGTTSSRKGIIRQIYQVQVMLKSLLVMEYEYLRRIREHANGEHGSHSARIEFILFTDDKAYFQQLANFLYNSGQFHFEYLKLIKLIYAPVLIARKEYNSRPCATLRLYLDQLLPNHTEIIYLDTDLIFLKPVMELYNDFHKFNQSQWIGMAVATYDSHSKGRIPYYGFYGLNSGVALYNLTRMRQSRISKSIDDIFANYGEEQIYYADQDILNIYFHFHPQEVKVLQCHRNFIGSFCKNQVRRPGLRCSSISTFGITILHGVKMAFTPESTVLKFRAVFNFFQNLNLSKLYTMDQIQKTLEETFSQKYVENDRGLCSYLNFPNDLLKY